MVLEAPVSKVVLMFNPYDALLIHVDELLQDISSGKIDPKESGQMTKFCERLITADQMHRGLIDGENASFRYLGLYWTTYKPVLDVFWNDYEARLRNIHGVISPELREACEEKMKVILASAASLAIEKAGRQSGIDVVLAPPNAKPKTGPSN